MSSEPDRAQATRTAIILVNWKGWRDTLECLASLMTLARPPLHIIVVDNASPNDSADIIESWCRGNIQAEIQQPILEIDSLVLKAPADLRWAMIGENDPMPPDCPQVVLVRSASNRGFAGGNNIGIKLALQRAVDFVWLLNTDTVVAPDALDSLLERALERPDAGMIGSSLIYYWHPGKVQALGGSRFDARTGVGLNIGHNLDVIAIPVDPSEIEAQTDYVIGASMLVSRGFIESIGLMCEDYFLYFEEIDWALRGQGRFALAYAPRSRVYHKVGGSSRRESSRLSLRYLYRNRLRFMARFFPGSLGQVKRHLVLSLLQHLRRGRWDDVREIAGALVAASGRASHGPLQ